MIIERLWGTKIDFSGPLMHVEKIICAILCFFEFVVQSIPKQNSDMIVQR